MRPRLDANVLRLPGHASMQYCGAFYNGGAGLVRRTGRFWVASSQATFGVLVLAIVSPRALTFHVMHANHRVLRLSLSFASALGLTLAFCFRICARR